jgi:metallo-beta-lactamase family protein
MPIIFTSHGGAGTVTGSRHLLETGGARILIDCGLHQERDLRGRDYDQPQFDLAALDAVILTHAHLDHCGLVPRYAAMGLHCPVYGSPATCAIAPVLWHDTARIMAEDALFKRRRHAKEGRRPAREVMPLYGEEEVLAAVPRLTPVATETPFAIAPGVVATLRSAGHILGSCTVELAIAGAPPFTFGCSGDLGRTGAPIIPDPAPPPVADVLVMEATYGDRTHPPPADVGSALAAAVNRCAARGGVVVIPSFAVERAQDLLWWFARLHRAGEIPALPVYLDSPMAVALLEVFREQRGGWGAAMTAASDLGVKALSFPGLHLTASAEESKEINRAKPPFVVIAGSGMCTGGRIKHHLARHLDRPENLVLFVGYQANGTLGRTILDGAERVRIHGHDHPVRAEVAQIRGFSGHADQHELIAWLRSAARPPGQVLAVHGGAGVLRTFAGLVTEQTGIPVRIPAVGEPLVLRAEPRQSP